MRLVDLSISVPSLLAIFQTQIIMKRPTDPMERKKKIRLVQRKLNRDANLSVMGVTPLNYYIYGKLK